MNALDTNVYIYALDADEPPSLPWVESPHEESEIHPVLMRLLAELANV